MIRVVGYFLLNLILYIVVFRPQPRQKNPEKEDSNVLREASLYSRKVMVVISCSDDICVQLQHYDASMHVNVVLLITLLFHKYY